MASMLSDVKSARELLKNKEIAICGVGETEQGKIPNKDTFQFLAEASRLAIRDAGLTPQDIDGVVTAFSLVEHTFMHAPTMCDWMGLRPRFYNSIAIGGATATWMMVEAAMAINAGLAETVLCVRGDNTLSAAGSGRAISLVSEMAHPDFEYIWGLMTPGGYAMVAQRHMHEYGTTGEQLARVAVSARNHAKLKENAAFKEDLTVEEIMASPYITAPLHVRDCSIVTDGGAAFVVTTGEKARQLKNAPVYISGMGEGLSRQYLTSIDGLGTIYDAIASAADSAFEISGLSMKDVDVAELYDCFTITTIMQLEGAGFCGKGEGGAYVEAGKIDLGGDGIPVNTHGGLLSQAHLGGMHHVVEAVLQLRGQAGPRQVPDAKVAFVTGNGGIFSAMSAAVLTSDKVL